MNRPEASPAKTRPALRLLVRGLGSLLVLAPAAPELSPRASAAERMRVSFERVGQAINRSTQAYGDETGQDRRA